MEECRALLEAAQEFSAQWWHMTEYWLEVGDLWDIISFITESYVPEECYWDEEVYHPPGESDLLQSFFEDGHE